MADIADRAQDEMYWTRRAIEHKHLAITPTLPPARYCAECGDEIPEARREAVPGVQLCVGCQQEADG